MLDAIRPFGSYLPLDAARPPFDSSPTLDKRLHSRTHRGRATNRRTSQSARTDTLASTRRRNDEWHRRATAKRAALNSSSWLIRRRPHRSRRRIFMIRIYHGHRVRRRTGRECNSRALEWAPAGRRAPHHPLALPLLMYFAALARTCVHTAHVCACVCVSGPGKYEVPSEFSASRKGANRWSMSGKPRPKREDETPGPEKYSGARSSFGGTSWTMAARFNTRDKEDAASNMRTSPPAAEEAAQRASLECGA
jgi:hypothetical protein